MAGTYGRVYLCLSTFGTDKVHSLSLVWFAHPKVGHGSSASEPMGPSREFEYTLLGVHAGRGSSTIRGSVLGLEYSQIFRVGMGSSDYAQRNMREV